jgi:hypothetical protein
MGGVPLVSACENCIKSTGKAVALVNSNLPEQDNHALRPTTQLIQHGCSMTTLRNSTPLLFLALATVAGISTFTTRLVSAEDAIPATAKPGVPEAVAVDDASAEKAETTSVEKADGVLLRYQFKKGQFVHYEEDSRSEMTLMAREQTQATRESRRTNKHFRVVSVDENGSAVVEPVIDRVQMEVRNDDDPAITYDSASKGDAAKDFQKVAETIGKPSLRIRYSASGRIEQLLPLIPRQVDQPAVEDPEKQNFLIAFPDEAIAIGEAWTDNYLVDVSVDGDLRNPLKKRVNIRRTYTLKDIANGVAEIQFRTFPLAIEHDPLVKGQLVHHSRFGSIQFDLNRGIILEWQSSGSGHVFEAFGPASSMKALSSTTERYIDAPSAIEKRQPLKPRRPAGPAGPQLPGTASL